MLQLIVLAALATSPAAPAEPARFDADIATVVAREHLPGVAVAVVDQGQVVYRHAEGMRGDGGRIDEDTLFKIASNSKAMTAALLARLVQQGRLRWDDPVQRHLPGFRMHDAWVGQQMQVRDLLIHNSGLGLGAGDLMLWPEPNAFTRADIIAGLAHLKPVTSFRSGYAYDNLMYVVAGEVAAAAGGKPYDQLMREQVFEPLGMARCQVGRWSVRDVGNVAQPHPPHPRRACRGRHRLPRQGREVRAPDEGVLSSRPSVCVAVPRHRRRRAWSGQARGGSSDHANRQKADQNAVGGGPPADQVDPPAVV